MNYRLKKAHQIINSKWRDEFKLFTQAHHKAVNLSRKLK